MEALLEIRNLTVAYRSHDGGKVSALENVSLCVARGEILGVLGESGSGKSTLALALLKVLPPNATQRTDVFSFEGEELSNAGHSRMRAVRGSRISLVFQEPGTALHPTMRAGDQVAEILRAHQSLSARERSSRSRKVMQHVFPSDLDRIYSSYPHQLSGGQRQRVAIAQAVVCGPSLLIADEPTASLDPASQHEVLELLKRLRRELELAMIFITHFPDILAGFADRVIAMYGGQIIEEGPTESVLRAPLHPYTRALLRCRPAPGAALDGALRELAAPGGPSKKLPVISGDPPDVRGDRRGCIFEPRCPDKIGACRENQPPWAIAEESRRVRCFLYEREANRDEDAWHLS